jgi:hypothetical protein
VSPQFGNKIGLHLIMYSAWLGCGHLFREALKVYSSKMWQKL